MKPKGESVDSEVACSGRSAAEEARYLVRNSLLFLTHGNQATIILFPPPVLPREPNRSAIQLEEALNSLTGAAIAGEKQAAALVSGEDEHPESGLAELRARHQVRPVEVKLV